MTLNGIEGRKSLSLLGWFGTVLFALFGILALAVFLFLDKLAPLIANPFLAPYGIHLQQIKGLQLDRNAISMNSLHFSLFGANRESQIDQLEIHFTDTGWLAFPIQLVRAARVDIGLAENTNASSADNSLVLPALPSIRELLETLQAIPGNAVDIGRLDIAPYIDNGQISVQRDDRELRVQIAAQDTSADFRVNWHDTNNTSSQALPDQTLDSIPVSSEVLTGRLLLEALGQQVLNTDFSISENAQRLQIDAHSNLQMQALSEFAQQASLLPASLLNVEGELNVTWRLVEPAPEDPTQTIPFSIIIAPHSRVDSAWRTELATSLHSINWQNSEELSALGSIALGLETLELQIAAPAMNFELGIGQAAPAQLAATIDALNIACSSRFTCSIEHSSNLSLPELTWLDTGIKNVLLISNGTVALEQGHVDLHFAQGSRFELGTLNSAALELLEVNALVQQALDLRIEDDGSVELSSGGVDLYLPNIIIEGKSSHLVSAISDLNGRLSATETRLQAHAQLRNIGSDWLPFIFRKPELELDIRSDSALLSATGLLNIADRELVTFEFEMDTSTFLGQAQFETPIINFGAGSLSLANLFFRAPFEADIVSGSLQSSAALKINRAADGNWLLNGPLQINVNEISGFYQDTAMINFSTNLSGTLQDSLNFVSDGLRPLSLANIDLGLPVEDITLQYGIDTLETRLSFENIEARLFGGRVHSTRFNYDWSAPNNSLTIDVERVDISRLLSLAAYDSIRATGFISGSIPITLTGLTPSVGDGHLQVEAPGGAIHYSPEGGINSGNATLDLVNQALSNYQYSLMETQVEYLPTGELELGIKLQGLNPDLNDGQRINLNLNISDNIPALLKSLQAGRSISDTLERELQTR